MAHQIFVRDTVSGDCGLATPPCPPVVQSADATVTVTQIGMPAAPIYDLSMNETITTLTYDPMTTVLTYTNEAGVVVNVDLSALAADIFVNGGTYNAATQVLTLTDNDGVTPDIVIPLGSLASTLAVNNATSEVTHTSGNGTITTWRRVSADAGNDISIGSDGAAYLDVQAHETITSMVHDGAGGVLYTDESGVSNTVTICQLASALPSVGLLQCV